MISNRYTIQLLRKDLLHLWLIMMLRYIWLHLCITCAKLKALCIDILVLHLLLYLFNTTLVAKWTLTASYSIVTLLSSLVLILHRRTNTLLSLSFTYNIPYDLIIFPFKHHILRSLFGSLIEVHSILSKTCITWNWIFMLTQERVDFIIWALLSPFCWFLSNIFTWSLIWTQFKILLLDTNSKLT